MYITVVTLIRSSPTFRLPPLPFLFSPNPFRRVISKLIKQCSELVLVVKIPFKIFKLIRKNIYYSKIQTEMEKIQKSQHTIYKIKIGDMRIK